MDLYTMEPWQVEAGRTQYPRNVGQAGQLAFSLFWTGEWKGADNVPHWEAGDVGDIQVKAHRAIVCQGTDFLQHMAIDAANSFCYISKDQQTCYIMTPNEWIEFVQEWGYLNQNSKKNKGGYTIRLKYESQEMIKWLKTKC